MLRRAHDLHAAYDPGPHRHGWLVLHVGNDHFRVKRIGKAEYRAIFRWAQQAPQPIAIVGRYACWLYQDRYFWDNLGLNQREVSALLAELGATA